MADVTITLACWNYDRLKPIIDGRVGVEGCTVAPIVLKSRATVPARLPSGIDVSNSVQQLSVAGGARRMRLCRHPLFPPRASFRHACVYGDRSRH